MSHIAQVEEEENPSQEVGQPEEDTERTESDTSRGKGPQHEEHAMGSVQQGLEPKEEQEIEQEGIPEVRASSPRGKKKAQDESSVQGIPHAQEELK
jgi:hypothetical protein